MKNSLANLLEWFRAAKALDVWDKDVERGKGAKWVDGSEWGSINMGEVDSIAGFVLQIVLIGVFIVIIWAIGSVWREATRTLKRAASTALFFAVVALYLLVHREHIIPYILGLLAVFVSPGALGSWWMKYRRAVREGWPEPTAAEKMLRGSTKQRLLTPKESATKYSDTCPPKYNAAYCPYCQKCVPREDGKYCTKHEIFL